jgi:hypothetical protein
MFSGLVSDSTILFCVILFFIMVSTVAVADVTTVFVCECVSSAFIAYIVQIVGGLSSSMDMGQCGVSFRHGAFVVGCLSAGRVQQWTLYGSLFGA